MEDTRFALLYRKYYWRVVRYFVFAFRVDEEDARDLTHDTFVRSFEAREQYRGDAEWGYLERIAQRVGLNRVRSRGTVKHGVEPLRFEDLELEPAGEDLDAADRVDGARRRKALHDAIAALPPRQRQCLQLHLEGFSRDEIARVLRVKPETVKSQLSDATRTLHRTLGKDNHR